jgi:hypothetical protein
MVLGFGSQRRPGIFLFTTASRTALWPTQSPIQWVPRALSLGIKGRNVNLATRLHLVPRSRMRGNIPPLPQYACMAWCSVKAQGRFYLYVYLLQLHENWNRTLSRSQARTVHYSAVMVFLFVLLHQYCYHFQKLLEWFASFFHKSVTRWFVSLSHDLKLILSSLHRIEASDSSSV